MALTKSKEKKETTSIQQDWKNAPSRDDLYSDFVSSENGQEDYKSKLREYESTLAGGKAPIKRKGRSTSVSLLSREHAEWKKPSLSEAILGTKNLFTVSPIGGEDSNAAKQNGIILNYQWNNKIKKINLIDDIVRVLVEEGTVVVKTGWEAVEGTKFVEKEQPVFASPEESMQMMQQAVEAGQMDPQQVQAMVESGQPMQKGTEIVYVEEPTLIKNQPTYEVCTNANVVVDPTCNGIIENANFIIYEFDTSYADLKQEEYLLDEESGEESGFYHNIEEFEDGIGGEDTYDEFKPQASNQFKFSDPTRRRLRAYEYWGYWDIQGDGILVPIIGTWIGRTLIRLEENPLAHNRLPFSSCAYMPRKNTIAGEPDAELLRENQESVARMIRAIHDKTAEDAVGQTFINENLLSPSAKNAYEKGNTVYYRGNLHPKDAIWKNNVQQLNSTPFDVISWQEKKASEMSGTRSFAGPGSTPKLSTNKDTKDSMDATAKRELSILRRISTMFEDMARMTIAMNQSYLSDTEVIRITGDEFVTIARDDLEGNFDLAVEISTPEKDADQATKLMTLLQTNQANMDRELQKIFYVQLLDLWKMPTASDQIKQFEPKPNPEAQQKMKLEIQEQELKNALIMKQMEDIDSKITERLSREIENKADIIKKEAEGMKAIAEAEKLKAETDIIDQQFLNIENGVKREEDLEDKELDAVYKERDEITRSIKVVV